jgi:hypothetical protein
MRDTASNRLRRRHADGDGLVGRFKRLRTFSHRPTSSLRRSVSDDRYHHSRGEEARAQPRRTPPRAMAVVQVTSFSSAVRRAGLP